MWVSEVEGAGVRGLEVSRRECGFVSTKRRVEGDGKGCVFGEEGGGWRRRARRWDSVGVWRWWKEGLERGVGERVVESGWEVSVAWVSGEVW